MHRSPIPKLQGPPPEKRPQKFFALRANHLAACTESTRPTFRRCRAQRALVAALCAAGGPGAEPLVLGNFGHFAHFLHPKKRRLWAATAQGHARRHRALRPPYRPPFVPLRLARIVLHELPSPDCSRESRQPEWQWQGQGAGREGGGQRKPGTGGGIGDAPRPALAPDPHNPPRCCRSTTGCTSLRGGRGSRGGVGIGWWWGSTIKLAVLHPEAPPAPHRRRRLLRSAARARDGAPAGQG